MAAPTSEDAYRQTLSELDDIYALRAGVDASQRVVPLEPVPPGDSSSRTVLTDLLRDLRYAGRALRANPLFALVVVVTLGLGIGANTTVFTVINAVILSPLPVTAPSELVAVASVASMGATQANALLPLSHPNFADYETHNTVFSALAGYSTKRALTWEAQGGSQPVLSEFVTPNYFQMLGVRAALGRTFSPEADSLEGPPAVMNYGTWQTRFGGAADIVGRRLRVNSVIVTVIGVAPQGFIGVNGVVGPELWLPFAASEQLLPNEMRAAVNDRSKPLLQGIARLKSGVTLAQANANIAALSATLAREYPDANEGQTVAVRPIADVLFGGASTMVRFAGMVLAIVSGVVLLIACSNVANLLLARFAARQQEMAVRMALGASRARLVRQLLTESISLGLISGGIGLLIAFLAHAAPREIPAGDRRLHDVEA